MLFPDLRDKKFGCIHLNTEAQRWFLKYNIDTHTNPLLDPEICQRMIDEVHAREGLDFSYGGWLEDRSDVWRGSYLEKGGMFLHVGVDFHVPTGTRIAADCRANVLRVETDFPLVGGWGNMVILKCVDRPDMLLYAHLDGEVSCKTGDMLSPGDVFAKVGMAPRNGGWFPHLHVQCIDQSYFEGLNADEFEKLDGYVSAQKVAEYTRYFKDPFTIVSL